MVIIVEKHRSKDLVKNIVESIFIILLNFSCWKWPKLIQFIFKMKKLGWSYDLPSTIEFISSLLIEREIWCLVFLRTRNILVSWKFISVICITMFPQVSVIDLKICDPLWTYLFPCLHFDCIFSIYVCGVLY